jgi:hypothetical protein
MFTARKFSAERKCLCGETNVKIADDPEKYRDRPETSHTDENCVNVEGLIREERRVKIRETLRKKKKHLCNITIIRK